MTNYEKALELWRRKHIQTDAELAEALNGTASPLPTIPGKSKMTALPTMTRGKSLNITV